MRWRRVGLFYLITFGWAVLVTAALYLSGTRDLTAVSAPVILVLALGYMPAPMVAALIIQRLDHAGSPLRGALRGFKRNFGRIVLVVSLLLAALLAAMLGLSWLAGNRLDLTGAGVLLTAPADLLANALYLIGSASSDQVDAMRASFPGFGALLVITYLGALLAGFTVNGLVAFGEEYGWRGWLADELRPLGAFWANLITGVGWGLWHAPLILLGYNYGGSRIGAAFMVAWCVLASFLLWRSRQVTGSLLTPAILHGSINASAGMFVLVLANPNPLIAAPLGLLGMAALGLVTAIFWAATSKWARQAG